MFNSAWFNLNKDCSNLKLHDKCPNIKSYCQISITFTPNQYMLECGSIKKVQKLTEGNDKPWTKLLKPAVNIASPYIGMAVSARTKNPQIGKATSDILKSMSAGKILRLADLHGNGLRLKVT